jgi:hypothetical protein
MLKHIRNIAIGEIIIYLCIRPGDLEVFFLFFGIILIIISLFSVINVIVDGRTAKIGRGFSSGGGYSNRLLVAKFLQATFGTDKLYDRGKEMNLDRINISMIVGGLLNILLYLMVARNI